MSTKSTWLLFSILGLILVGSGFSVAGEAVIRKAAGEPWFWMGTAGLVILNSGLSFFGSGVVARVRMLQTEQ